MARGSQPCFWLSMSHHPSRRSLPHQIPGWVDENNEWFITICCTPKGRNQLALPAVHASLEAGFAHYATLNKMYVRTWTVMPDHLHFIARFNHREGMSKVVAGIKHYLAFRHEIRWQKGFFDHRLRSDKEMEAKCAYVRLNPVRAGLVNSPDEWPYRGD